MNERPLDIIHIRDLKLRCVLGVSQEERREKQDVVLNIHMHADLEEPCLTDRLSDRPTAMATALCFFASSLRFPTISPFKSLSFSVTVKIFAILSNTSASNVRFMILRLS